uniref:Uncharacterized protein n=1 Tax=Anguilla anguilla TaxID=7936 RepID=A0A0E9T113_ANGAN
MQVQLIVICLATECFVTNQNGFFLCPCVHTLTN